MNASKTTKEGKVNVALGDKEIALGRQASINGTTKTALARVLILEGLKGLESGAIRFHPATIEIANEPDGRAA